jgi:HK97 family phage major capsid protein
METTEAPIITVEQITAFRKLDPAQQVGQLRGQSAERAFSVQRDGAIDKEARTVWLSIASDAPYARWWGNEILDMNPSSVRDTRLKQGLPGLVDHNPADIVAKAMNFEFTPDRKLRVLARFGKSARAEEIWQDILDGIRTDCSVGYVIHDLVLESQQEDVSTYRVTAWEPLEFSMVSMPADPSVGVGRQLQTKQPPLLIEKETIMEVNDKAADINTSVIENAVREKEMKRINDLEALGQQFKQFGGEALARKHMAEGKTVGDLQTALLAVVGKREVPDAAIGMDEKEIKQFSFMRALNALANPADRAAQAAAGFEREVSEAAAKKSGKSPTGILVPTDVLRSALMTDFGAANQGYNAMARAMATMMRDLTVGTSTAGGHTVSTNLLAGSFIELLRSRMVMARLGATMLNGLTGNIAVPRQTSGATAYWVAESGAPTETQQAFDQVTMTPKTCGAFTDYSRKLLLQSSIDVEAFIRMDLAKVIGLELDRVALYGTGSSNQPRGIDQTAGINTVNFAAAAPTFAEIVNMETQVAADNADVGTLAYLVNATGRGGLKTAEKASSTGQFIWENGNTVNGYRAEVSNQVAAGDFWFGNWADVLMGFWSGLDLTVDPYTGSTSGTVRVVALQDVDVAVRHPESFCNGADNP